jgi:phosphotransferase system HPr-like phosphotransfer protein
LLALAAEQGTELILEVCGDDQQQAHEALLTLLNTLAAEDQQNNDPAS